MHSQANHVRERRRRLGAADRSRRHPIRSTILLAAIAVGLATVALVLVASGKPVVAASSLNNGNFETGDLTGWTVDTPASGGGASAVTGYDYYAQISCTPENSYGGPCYSLYTMPPREGSYFALLQHLRTSGDSQTWNTKISQPFEASNGDKVSGWAFFQTDFSGSLDKGQVVITNLDSGTTVATPFENSDDYGGPKVWTYWEHTFAGVTGTGTFQIEARLQNIADYAYPGQSSAMGLEDVKTTTASNDDTTPPTVTDTFPTGTNVDRTTNVSATFSEDMLASSINGTTFKLFKKGSTTQISATVSYDPTTRTATLNPFGTTTTRLARGSTYKAVVTTGATDMAGNQLDQDPTLDGLQQKKWFFTTAS